MNPQPTVEPLGHVELYQLRRPTRQRSPSLSWSMRADLFCPAKRFLAPQATAYRSERVAHWDKLAGSQRGWRLFARQYHRRLERVYRFIIPRGMRVLELGCAEGDLLAALEPSQGTGVDFSSRDGRRRPQSSSCRYPIGWFPTLTICRH